MAPENGSYYDGWRAYSLYFLMGMICIGVFLTNPINSVPNDIWYQTSNMISETSETRISHFPIAAPAFLYFSLRNAMELFDAPQEWEPYLIVFTHNLLLLASGVALHRIGKYLDLGPLHGFFCLFYVAYVESTFITQSIYSEATTMPLTVFAMYVAFRQSYGHDARKSKNVMGHILCGALIGLALATRLTLAFLIPGFLILFYITRYGNADIKKKVLAFVACIVIIVLVLSFANYMRSGHFELMSPGKHLYQGVYRVGIELFAGDEDYALIKKEVGHDRVENIDAHQLRRYLLKSKDPRLQEIALTKRSYERFLYSLTTKWMVRRPHIVLDWANKKMMRNIMLEIPRVGLRRGETTLFGTNGTIEPLVYVWRDVRIDLNPAPNLFLSQIYRYLLIFSYISLTAVLLALAWMQVTKVRKMPIPARILGFDTDRLRGISSQVLCLSISYFSMVFFVSLAGISSKRYPLTRLPLIILLASILFDIVISKLRQRIL